MSNYKRLYSLCNKIRTEQQKHIGIARLLAQHITILINRCEAYKRRELLLEKSLISLSVILYKEDILPIEKIEKVKDILRYIVIRGAKIPKPEEITENLDADLLRQGYELLI